MTIFDYFTAKAVAIYWNEIQDATPPFLFEYYFPNEKIESDDFSYIKGADSNPVALKISNYDANPTFRDLKGFEEYKGSLAFFREGYEIKEKDRRELLRAISYGDDRVVNTLLAKIYRQVADLILGAAVVREILRTQLVLTGKINYSGNGCTFVADYGMGSDQKVKPTTKWNTEGGDPFSDLRKWKRAADKRNGQNNNTVVMNSETFDAFYENAAIKELFKANQMGVITEPKLKNLFRDELNVEIVFYDKTYKKDEKSARIPFIPKGQAVLLPDTKIGRTYFAPTPEETDLAYNPNFNGEVEIVDTGVAVTTYVANEVPVKLAIIASQAVAPSFELGENVTVITDLL